MTDAAAAAAAGAASSPSPASRPTKRNATVVGRIIFSLVIPTMVLMLISQRNLSLFGKSSAVVHGGSTHVASKPQKAGEASGKRKNQGSRKTSLTQAAKQDSLANNKPNRKPRTPFASTEEVEVALQKRDGKNFSHCFFRTYPRPTRDPDFPLVGEVFASHDRSKVHIALENRQICQKQYDRKHLFAEKKVSYRCIFEKDGSSTRSEPIYVDEPKQVFVLVTCPVPKHLRRSLPGTGSPLTHAHLTLETITSPSGVSYVKNVTAAPRVKHLPICSHAWPTDPHIAAPKVEDNNSKNNNNNNNKPSPQRKHFKFSLMTRVSASYQRGLDYEKLGVTRSEFVLWMEYHLAIGVNHFYIYDDSPSSEDSIIRTWCEPYIARSLVTYVLYNYRDIDCDKGPRKGSMMYIAQIVSTSAALHRYQNETEWMGHWDVDEFMVLPKNTNMWKFMTREGSGVDEVGFWSPTYGKCESNSTISASQDQKMSAMEKKQCYREEHKRKGAYRTGRVLCFRVHTSHLTVNNTRTRRNLVPHSKAHIAHFRKGAIAGTSFPERSNSFQNWIEPMRVAVRKAMRLYPKQQPSFTNSTKNGLEPKQS